MAKVPVVIPKEGDRAVDIYSRLLEERIVFIGEVIDEELASSVVAQLLFLEKKSPKKDVVMYVNTPGGAVHAGLAIYDVMQMLRCDVSTVCVGMAASAGAVLLAAGKKGKRYASANARIMIHQPWGGIRGVASDVSIQAEEMLKTRERLNDILARHTGQTVERIELDTERDRFMSPEEAREYGIIDGICEETSP